jgi:uncharacterized protein (DUF2235 family)
MRRLIVCADGTWSTPEETSDGIAAPTNVCKMKEALAATSPDGRQQLVYYHDGVGADGNVIAHVAGGISGDGIDGIIKACYAWLNQNYQDGDEMFLFGFSRGAYTVRSLAGLVRKCGLLKPAFAGKVDDAYAFYRDDTVPNAPAAVAFRAQYSLERYVTFIGVWDTVGSLGIPIPALQFLDRAKYEFHDVALSRTVTYAYQALGVDEQRLSFEPCLWEKQEAPGQTLEQVWFTGSHSSIGGGYADAGLSDLTFDWMRRRAAAAGLGFDAAFLAANIKPNGNGTLYDSMTPMYKALGVHIRPIREPRTDKAGNPIDTQESLSQSAYTRYQGQGYSPSNITDYIGRVPPDSAGAITS